MSELQRAVVDFIPLIWCEPQAQTGKQRQLVIWLPGFSGDKEGVAEQLRDLAGEGFVALSFDPYQHGERRVESNEELWARVASNIRRHFWPILAHTAHDTLRVIDWAIETLDVESAIRMGGISMGGDISIAAAGIDSRIERVAVCISTADWLRPGSSEPPGSADAYAQLCYRRCNPLTNRENYARCPRINFQCGADDAPVPPDGARRFVESLGATYADCPERLRVDLHTGVGHQFTPEMWENARRWLSETA